MARRAVRVGLEAQRVAGAAQRLAEAEWSLAEAGGDELRSSFHAARLAVAAAPPSEPLTRRLSALETEFGARERAAQIGDVVQLLAGPERRSALLRYAALSPEVRREVRERVRLSELNELEPLLGRRVEPAVVIDAMITLGEVTTRAELDPEAALIQLSPHIHILAGVPSVVRLLARIRERIRSGKLRRTEERLAAARDALEREEPAVALDLLGKIAQKDLETWEREVVDGLRARARTLLETCEMEASYEHALRAGEPLQAREVAERLLARADEGQRAYRLRQIEAARAAVCQAFGVWVARADEGDAVAVEDQPSRTIEIGVSVSIDAAQEDISPWLGADGRACVVIECCDRWVFIHDIDLMRGVVRGRAILRTPESLRRPTTAITPAGSLVLAGATGAILELSPETWEPLSWRAGRELMSGVIVDDVEIAPGGRFVWFKARRDVHDLGRTQVYDVAQRRVVRELGDGWWFRPLVAGTPMMAYSRREAALSLHHPSGAPAEGGKLESPGNAHSAVAHPGDKRLLVFVGADDDEAGERLGLVEVDTAGRASSPVWLDDVDATRTWSCATALAHRTTFLVAYDENGRVWLNALRPAWPTGLLTRSYRVPIPAETWLVQDPSSRWVAALVPDHDRVHIVRLSDSPPVFPEQVAQAEYVRVPGYGYSCSFGAMFGDEFFQLQRELRGQSEQTILMWMRRRLANAAGDTFRVLQTYDVLRCTSHPGAVDELLGWMAEHMPSDPHTAVLTAEMHAKGERWSDVRALLDGVDLRGLAADRRQHAFHILGLALLRAGEVERAVALFQEGCDTCSGNCHLGELLMAVSPSLPSDGSAPTSGLVALRRAIAEADSRLDRHDLPAARAALDHRFVWCGDEVQSLARLAEVELASAAEGDVALQRKALALARFLHAHRTSPLLRKEMPLPQTGWSPARIAEVERRAQAWLDRLGTEERRGQSASALDEAEAEVPADVASLLPWALALQELGAELEAIAAETSTRTPARLAFRVRNSGRRFEGIDVMLQRAGRGGRFSSGQVVDPADLVVVQAMLAEESDQAAVVVLTEGLGGVRARPVPSRVRMLRLLAVLVGHPRVFVDGSLDPARVVDGGIGVTLVEVADGFDLRFIMGGVCWTADELFAQADSSMAVDVDCDARTVTLARLGPEVRALLEVLVRHRPSFPPESEDELLRRLGALQHVVALELPPRIAGGLVEAGGRPVARITPCEDGAVLVEIGVRPVCGAVFGPPGEGSSLILGAVDGVRVSAHRDLAGERAAAERLVARLGLDAARREGRWRFRLVGEEQMFAVVESLAELGSEVVVDWPKDSCAWRWGGRVRPGELRVRVAVERDLLRIEGEIEVDGHRVALVRLLEAIAEGRRYVIVGPQLFIALAAELRARLEAVGDLIYPDHGGIEAGLAAAPDLADLVGASSETAWLALCERFKGAGALDPEIPTGLRAELRPYQSEGFRWLARLSAWAPGACLADDMGLGKTLQALALLVYRAVLGPALVIAPTSVIPNWRSECARFAPGLRVRSYQGGERVSLLADAAAGDVFVAGYGVVTRDADVLAQVRFATLVLDEAHGIKNAMTRRTRAVGQLQADFRVALTGTPVENHLGELWSLFRVISPGLLGTWPQFRDRFAAPIEREQNGPRRAALVRVLRPFLLRRTKEAVLPELPPRIELDRLVNLSAAEREVYEAARLAAAAAIAAAAEPSERFAVLGWLTRLRRLACHPRMFDEAWTRGSSKLAAFLSIVDELRDSGRRALVFSQFTDHLAIVRQALSARGVPVEYLDGAMTAEERARAVEAFQGGAGDLFLISLKAGGTGLNLTAADHVIHLDPWWNPAVEDQATDRAHRIGQVRPVTVIRLIARGTIEEAVLALHAAKRTLAETVLQGSDAVARMSVDELVALVRGETPDERNTEEDEAETDPERHEASR